MRVAIVSPHPVYPPDSGDRVRTSQLLTGLRKHGVEPHLVAWSWSKHVAESPWPSEFIPGKPFARLPWLAWRLELYARRRLDPFAQFRMAVVRSTLVPAILRASPDVVDFQHPYTWVPTGIPDVCTFHNAETHLAPHLGQTTVRRVNAVRELEKRVLASVRAAVVFSEADAVRLHTLAPSDAFVATVPLGLRPMGAPRKTTHSRHMRSAVFVGTLSYPPNADAARALVEMWPRLRAESGLERLVIVGRDALRVVKGGDGIEVFSDVDSITPFLVDADVMLVPLLAGGGVRVKIIEAFAHGLPVVSTSIGVEGLAVQDGVHAVVVDEPADIPTRLQQLASVGTRRKLADGAYELWQTEYSPETMVASMLEVYERTLRGARQADPTPAKEWSTRS